jgi:hypothetical protein
MPRDHVLDEDRELELRRDERGEPDRDQDRRDREDQRQPGGDERAEDEHEDDHRRGHAEAELAVLEIVLRDLVEVVVGR